MSYDIYWTRVRITIQIYHIQIHLYSNHMHLLHETCSLYLALHVLLTLHRVLRHLLDKMSPHNKSNPSPLISILYISSFKPLAPNSRTMYFPVALAPTTHETQSHPPAKTPILHPHPSTIFHAHNRKNMSSPAIALQFLLSYIHKDRAGVLRKMPLCG